MTITLVTGDDDTVRGEHVRRLVTDLVGGGDAALAVDTFEGDDYDLARAVDAAATPPFLSDRRVVVARHLRRFTASDLEPLLGYLADPVATTSLVLVWEKGPGDSPGPAAPPKALKEAVTAAGGEAVSTSVGRGRDRRTWLEGRFSDAGLRLDRDVLDAVADHLGDDVDRAGGLVASLVSTFGEGARLDRAAVAPYLGERGTVAPWELTDAIDRGDIAGALDRLGRLTGAGGMHALQVMGVLTNHARRILALEGSGARDEREAAEVLGIKGSTFPAKKALGRSRALGYDGAAEAVTRLADADVDLRGGRAWPDALVLEVLVARLARLNRG